MDKGKKEKKGNIQNWFQPILDNDVASDNISKALSLKYHNFWSFVYFTDKLDTMMSLATKTAAVRAPVSVNTRSSRRSMVVRASANTNDMCQVRCARLYKYFSIFITKWHPDGWLATAIDFNSLDTGSDLFSLAWDPRFVVAHCCIWHPLLIFSIEILLM